MTDTQKYLFDLQGFLIVEDVLSDAECELAKRKIREHMEPMDKTPDGYDSNGTWQRGLRTGEPRRAVHHPDRPSQAGLRPDRNHRPQAAAGGQLQLRALERLPALRDAWRPPRRPGELPLLRARRPDSTPGSPSCRSPCRRSPRRTGGFACIPGSHKCDFHVPPEDHKRLFAIDGPLVRNIAAPKGSAIIFTETLAHGGRVLAGRRAPLRRLLQVQRPRGDLRLPALSPSPPRRPWRSSRRRSASSSTAPGRRSARRTIRTTITRRPESSGHAPRAPRTSTTWRRSISA